MSYKGESFYVLIKGEAPLYFGVYTEDCSEELSLLLSTVQNKIPGMQSGRQRRIWKNSSHEGVYDELSNLINKIDEAITEAESVTA